MRRLLLFIFIFSLFLTGCLDFTGHEMIAYRSGQDLYLLIMYHGIQETQQKDKQESPELKEWMRDGDEFYPPYIFGRVKLGEIRKGLTPDNKRDHPAAYQFESFFVEHTDIGMGNFYLDAKTGRLGAYEMVRLREVNKGLKLFNAAVCEALTEKGGLASSGDFQSMAKNYPQTWKVWLDACRKKSWKLVGLEGSALALDFSIDPLEFPRMRKDLVKTLFTDEVKTTSSQAMMAQFLANHPISLVQNTDRIQLTIGAPKAQFNNLTKSVEPNQRFSNNLVKQAAKSPLWTTPQDPERIIYQFKQEPKAFFQRQHFINQPAGRKLSLLQKLSPLRRRPSDHPPK